jgi:hypothetical protein
MVCQRCEETPGFHSFDLLGDVSGTAFYYCYPAHNKQSVRTQEDMLNFVSHFPIDRPWSLVFHANGYGLSNMMPLSIAIEMGNLVQETHKKTLQKIYIVEGSWFMNFLLRCIFPFLQKSMRNKFVLVEGSLLEVMQSLQREGLSLHQMEFLRKRFGKI